MKRDDEDRDVHHRRERERLTEEAIEPAPVGPTATPRRHELEEERDVAGVVEPDDAPVAGRQRLLARTIRGDAAPVAQEIVDRARLARSIDSLPDMPSASVSTKPVASADGRKSGKCSPSRDAAR